jgi:hypothetical protein
MNGGFQRLLIDKKDHIFLRYGMKSERLKIRSRRWYHRRLQNFQIWETCSRKFKFYFCICFMKTASAWAAACSAWAAADSARAAAFSALFAAFCAF